MIIIPILMIFNGPNLSIRIPAKGANKDAKSKVMITVLLISASLDPNSSMSLGNSVSGTKSVMALVKK